MHHHYLNFMKLKLEQFDLLFYSNIIAILMHKVILDFGRMEKLQI